MQLKCKMKCLAAVYAAMLNCSLGPQEERAVAPLLPRKLTLSLGLFSGASLSASWIVVNTYDYIGAVSIGTAACATILILLRFETRTPDHNRRRGDDGGSAAAA